MEARPITLAKLNTKRHATPPLALGEGRGEGNSGTSTIIDEAFAGFTRIDAPEPSGRHNDTWRHTKQDLVANIAIQLEALDRQRAQLARLLEDIDTTSVSM